MSTWSRSRSSSWSPSSSSLAFVCLSPSLAGGADDEGERERAAPTQALTSRAPPPRPASSVLRPARAHPQTLQCSQGFSQQRGQTPVDRSPSPPVAADTRPDGTVQAQCSAVRFRVSPPPVTHRPTALGSPSLHPSSLTSPSSERASVLSVLLSSSVFTSRGSRSQRFRFRYRLRPSAVLVMLAICSHPSALFWCCALAP